MGHLPLCTLTPSLGQAHRTLWAWPQGQPLCCHDRHRKGFSPALTVKGCWDESPHLCDPKACHHLRLSLVAYMNLGPLSPPRTSGSAVLRNDLAAVTYSRCGVRETSPPGGGGASSLALCVDIAGRTSEDALPCLPDQGLAVIALVGPSARRSRVLRLHGDVHQGVSAPVF